jgi:hypothetical protein
MARAPDAPMSFPYRKQRGTLADNDWSVLRFRNMEGARTEKIEVGQSVVAMQRFGQHPSSVIAKHIV